MAPSQLHTGGGVYRSLKCASCFEFKYDNKSLDRMLVCGHYYCRDCLASYSKTSIESGSYPFCCSDRIPLNSLSTALSGRNYGLATRLNKEYYRGLGYCAVASCSAEILAHKINGGVGSCDKCGARTCLHCNNIDHGSKACSRDAGTVKLLELASRNSWRQCPRCRVMIELSGGCDDIKCRVCNEKFCFSCGKSRNKCSCMISLCSVM